MKPLPKMRTDIQLIPARMQERQVVAVRDLLGLREETVVLPAEAVRLLSLFDGEHTILDLQQALMRDRGGQLVMREEAEKIVGDLDRLLLLQTPRMKKQKEEMKRAFGRLDHRPPFMAGSAYPEDRGALDAMLEGILSESGEPGRQNGVRVLVAPHIDLKAGRETYARAYGVLPGGKPRRIIVMGTGHTVEEGRISLTDKDYRTPLGGFPTDREAVNSLREAGADRVEPDDFNHRKEHAIEFQMLFLRHLLSGDIPVVPILFGSFHKYLGEVRQPEDIPGMKRLLQRLASLADADTLVVAGVDLSHVGPKFGHRDPAAVYEEEFRAHDQKLLEALCAGSVTDFWAEGQRVEDRFNVCGFPVLACLLQILPSLSGKVLDYRVWHETSTRSAVSFAAVSMG